MNCCHGEPDRNRPRHATNVKGMKERQGLKNCSRLKPYGTGSSTQDLVMICKGKGASQVVALGVKNLPAMHRRVGGLLGVAGRLSGTVSPFRAEQVQAQCGLAFLTGPSHLKTDLVLNK